MGDHPTENVSVAYGKVKYTYIDQKKADGTPGGSRPISHDLTLNKVE
jgi:type VI secretion system secreted protein Hcp